jgi:hypothetical protein
LTVVVLSATAGVSEAKTLRNVINPGEVFSGEVRGLDAFSKAIAVQVANQIPTLSTSAGYTYRWNPDLEVLERSAKTYGPLFTERAVTLGRNRFNVSAAYTYIKFSEFNGKNLDKLTNQVEKAFVPETGRTEYFGLFRPYQDVDDPSITRLAGDQITANLDLEAQLFDFSFTYGLLDDLDLNIDLPVLLTYARSSFQETLPDPRCLGTSEDCDIALATLGGDDNGFFHLPPIETRSTKLGLGDVRFRAKWAPITDPIRLAGLLALAVPTGDPSNFHGTGDTRLGATLIASKDVFSMLELHSQAGVEFTCNDVDRSQARYAAGATAQLTSFFALTADFIGRSEFAAQARVPNEGRLPAVRTIDGVPTLTQPLSELQNDNGFKGRPLFVDIKRNDVLDLAIGGRFSIGENAMIIANFLVPLNQDGLRADFVPTIAAEVSF